MLTIKKIEQALIEEIKQAKLVIKEQQRLIEENENLIVRLYINEKNKKKINKEIESVAKTIIGGKNNAGS